jgi:hypothetical protein
MEGIDYKEGHPTYHPMVHNLEAGYYLVAKSLNPQWEHEEDSIIHKDRANNYILLDATYEEKQKLIEEGYQMIGLKNKELKVDYTENQNEIKTITVCGKEFKCLSEFGSEYLDQSNRKYSCGFPIQPYKKEVIVNENRAYLIDACDIIWIYREEILDNINYGYVFVRPCHKEGDIYIAGGYNNYLKEVLGEKGYDNYLKNLGKINYEK